MKFWICKAIFQFGIRKLNARTCYYLKNICDSSLLRVQYLILLSLIRDYIIEKLRISPSRVIIIILNRHKKEIAYPIICFLKFLPVQHLFIYKVLKLFRMKSGNKGTNNLYYQTIGNSQRIFRQPNVNQSIFKQSYKDIAP